MRRFAVFGVAALLLVAGLWLADTRLVAPPVATGTPTLLPTRTPEDTPTPLAQASPRAVVVALGGVQAARVHQYLADGTMPNLAALKAQGAMAQYALSVDPPQAAPGHAALATGSYPDGTGVAGDRYQRPGSDLGAATNAVDGADYGAEPVWRQAMRQAQRTAALFWPGTSLDAPSTLADATVTRGVIDAASALHVVTFTEAISWTAAPESYSALREGTLTVRKDGAALAHVYVLAVDTVDDGRPVYDTYILSRDREVSAASATLHAGETAPLGIDPNVVSGAYFTLTGVAADRVTIYQGPVYYNQAQPDELVRAINQRFGFIPPGPDGAALARGWLTCSQLLHQADVQAQWMISVTTFVLDSYKPDLLFVSLPPAEELERQFLLTDPRQPGYSAELAAEYARYLRHGYALADEALAELTAGLDLGWTTLLVVSDHGMAPVHTEVYLNTILAGASYGGRKLLVWGAAPDYAVNPGQTRAVAVGSGGAAHIYINLRGRERAGSVPEEDYPEVQDAVVAALQAVVGQEGQPVFARILRRSDLRELHLEAESAGDLFVQAAPGFALSDARGQPAPLGPAVSRGEGGYDASIPEMQGIFLAAGRGIRPGLEVGPVHVLDLAPTLDRLLGFEQGPSLSGRVLEEILLP